VHGWPALDAVDRLALSWTCKLLHVTFGTRAHAIPVVSEGESAWFALLRVFDVKRLAHMRPRPPPDLLYNDSAIISTSGCAGRLLAQVMASAPGSVTSDDLRVAMCVLYGGLGVDTAPWRPFGKRVTKPWLCGAEARTPHAMSQLAIIRDAFPNMTADGLEYALDDPPKI
jgi:hypothetical protein